MHFTQCLGPTSRRIIKRENLNTASHRKVNELDALLPLFQFLKQVLKLLSSLPVFQSTVWRPISVPDILVSI